MKKPCRATLLRVLPATLRTHVLVRHRVSVRRPRHASCSAHPQRTAVPRRYRLRRDRAGLLRLHSRRDRRPDQPPRLAGLCASPGQVLFCDRLSHRDQHPPKLREHPALRGPSLSVHPARRGNLRQCRRLPGQRQRRSVQSPRCLVRAPGVHREGLCRRPPLAVMRSPVLA